MRQLKHFLGASRLYEAVGLVFVFTDDPGEAARLAETVRRLGLASEVAVFGTQIMIVPRRTRP